MSTPQKLTKFYISETQNLVYTLKQAKNPHTATRGNLIAVDDKYATFYEYTKGADGKISLTKVAGRINYSSLDWCRLCGEPIFKEGFSFCCERHAGKHLEMANMDFEEKMYDRGIPVRHYE